MSLLWRRPYDDTRYVVELAAPNTVNTMPAATLEAVADHGRPHGDAITGTYGAAREVFRELEQTGIDFADVVKGLEEQGLASFAKSWDELIASVTGQLKKAGAEVTSEGAVKPIAMEGKKSAATPPSAAPRQTAAE
jgi:transaldolase